MSKLLSTIHIRRVLQGSYWALSCCYSRSLQQKPNSSAFQHQVSLSKSGA